jgi:RHS repeat-associated protein
VAKPASRVFSRSPEVVSAALKPSPPHRIKAAHRRRRRVASGQSVQRYYDPAIGRFLSVDPVGPLQNPINHFGRYHYANNNPYRNTDPDGRAAMDWGERYRATQQLAVDLGGTPQDGNNAIASGLGTGAAIAGGVVAVGAAVPAATTAVLTNPVGATAVAEAVVLGGVGAATGADVPGSIPASTVSKLAPGAFAAESIPASSTAQTFTSAERAAINRIGAETGCHSCGSLDPGTKSGNFVPDHQPVTSLSPPGTPQQLYPQCLTCSKQQGLEAARELRKRQ